VDLLLGDRVVTVKRHVLPGAQHLVDPLRGEVEKHTSSEAL